MEAQWYPKQDGEDDEQSPYLESLLTSESSPDFKLYFYHLSGRRPAQNLFWKNPLISFTCLSSPKAPQKYHLQKIPLSLSVAWRSPLCSYLKPPSQPKKKYLSKKNSKPRRPSLCPSPRKMNLFFLRKCLFPKTKQKLLSSKDLYRPPKNSVPERWKTPLQEAHCLSTINQTKAPPQKISAACPQKPPLLCSLPPHAAGHLSKKISNGLLQSQNLSFSSLLFQKSPSLLRSSLNNQTKTPPLKRSLQPPLKWKSTTWKALHLQKNAPNGSPDHHSCSWPAAPPLKKPNKSSSSPLFCSSQPNSGKETTLLTKAAFLLPLWILPPHKPKQKLHHLFSLHYIHTC